VLLVQFLLVKERFADIDINLVLLVWIHGCEVEVIEYRESQLGSGSVSLAYT